MSPRHTDPAVRTALLEAAARTIATDGPASLTLRGVASEAGTSTMAVYTHFGGMPELRRAVRKEGFARLAAHLAELEASDDPVADLAMIGVAYYRNATGHPHLYRVMFLENPLDDEDAESGNATFETLVAGVRRCIATGRFAEGDPVALATELWSSTHGAITLHLAGCLPRGQAYDCLVGTVRHLFIGCGDDAEAVRKSLSQLPSDG